MHLQVRPRASDFSAKKITIETLGKKYEVMPEESPVGDHQANGDIENAFKELEKQI